MRWWRILIINVHLDYYYQSWKKSLSSSSSFESHWTIYNHWNLQNITFILWRAIQVRHTSIIQISTVLFFKPNVRFRCIDAIRIDFSFFRSLHTWIKTILFFLPILSYSSHSIIYHVRRCTSTAFLSSFAFLFFFVWT